MMTLELRGLLTPPRGCSSPCFMGIQPGVTTVDEALSRLQASAWVETVYYIGEGLSSPDVQWDWNGTAPDVFSQPAISYGGGLGIEHGVVQYIEIKTEVALGDAWLYWGAPENYTYLFTTGGPIGRPPPAKPFVYFYSEITLLSPAVCPYLRHFLESKSTFVIGNSNAWLIHFIPRVVNNNEQSATQFIKNATRDSCRAL